MWNHKWTTRRQTLKSPLDLRHMLNLLSFLNLSHSERKRQHIEPAAATVSAYFNLCCCWMYLQTQTTPSVLCRMSSCQRLWKQKPRLTWMKVFCQMDPHWLQLFHFQSRFPSKISTCSPWNAPHHLFLCSWCVWEQICKWAENSVCTECRLTHGAHWSMLTS